MFPSGDQFRGDGLTHDDIVFDKDSEIAALKERVKVLEHALDEYKKRDIWRFAGPKPTTNPPDTQSYFDEVQTTMKGWDRATLEGQYMNAVEAIWILNKAIADQRKSCPICEARQAESDTTNHCPICEANAKRIEFLEKALEEASPTFGIYRRDSLKRNKTMGAPPSNEILFSQGSSCFITVKPNLVKYLKEKP